MVPISGNELQHRVAMFTKKMQGQFEANQHKGDWRTNGVNVEHIIEQTKKKLETIEAVVRNRSPKVKIEAEAADLADWALMLADIYRQVP